MAGGGGVCGWSQYEACSVGGESLEPLIPALRGKGRCISEFEDSQGCTEKPRLKEERRWRAGGRK